nr:hypothetical protein [Tanacetum cinerariifolium]
NASTSSTNLINTASTPLSTAGPSRAFNDGELSYPDPSKYALPDDPLMTNLENIYASPSKRVFTDSSYDHEAVQTRSKVNKNSEAYALVSYIQKQQRNNHKDFQHCLFACFLSHIKPKKISQHWKMKVGLMLCKRNCCSSKFRSVKTASTPIETQKPLVKDEEAADVDVHLYRSMIGSLMYLTASRPDIMFAVCACSSKELASPKQMALGKDISNPLMAGRLPKTTLPT